MGKPGVVVGSAIGCAVVFEVHAVVSTQFRSVRPHSPWQDDPYNVMVSFALFAVPALVVLLGTRLAAGTWRAGDARWQMLRAALALLAVVDATLLTEWAAVLRRAQWTAVTDGLVAGTAVLTPAAATLTVLAVRAGAARRRRRPWTEDWLGDYAALLERVPAARRLRPTAIAAAVREHAVLVFAAASLAGGFAVIGALAVSEGWADPGLFAWAVAVETASNLCACLVVNAVAGIVARPARRHPRIEAAVVAACVAIQLAVAFRGSVWPALTGRPADSLAALTGITTAAAALAAAAVLAVTHRPLWISSRGSR